MEAGRKIKIPKGQNSLYGKEIFVFYPYVILHLFIFRTTIFNLISLTEKGILKSVFIGFVFLFLYVYSPVSGLLTAFSHHQSDSFQLINNLFFGHASKAMIAGSKATKQAIPGMPDTFLRPAYSAQLHIHETPGLTIAEASSSQLNFPGTIASNTYMLNQNPSL